MFWKFRKKNRLKRASPSGQDASRQHRTGKVLNDEEVKEYYAKKQPYGEWLDSYLVQLKDIKIPNLPVEEYTKEERMRLQKAFGYTYEEYRSSIGRWH